jgi:DNA polymerase III delta prime subunit
LANYISSQIDADFALVEDLHMDEIRNITDTVNYVSIKRVYCIENIQDMTPLVQNVLLKTLEDSDDKIIFILCADTKENILPTILSRCAIINLDAYTEEELQHYSKTRAGNIDIKYCKTPGDVTYKKYLVETGIYEELIKLTDLIATKITKANSANVFKIIKK